MTPPHKIQTKCLLAKLDSKSSVVSLLHQRPSDLLHALDSLSQVIVHQTPSDIPNLKWVVGAAGGGFVHTLICDGDFHQTRVSTQRNPAVVVAAVLIRRILPAVQLIPLIWTPALDINKLVILDHTDVPQGQHHFSTELKTSS